MRTRANTVVAIDVVEVIGPCVFLHPRIIERRSVVDLVPIDVNSENAPIGCERIYRPWDCNYLAVSSGDTCPFTTNRDNSVSHAAVATVDYDIFKYADFLTVGRCNFPAD
jgi:hypothetical protein